MLKDFTVCKSEKGKLTALNSFEKFQPKRIFCITDVPKMETRGRHAHKENEQFLICVSGEILVTLHDGNVMENYYMIEGDVLHIKNMIWSSQQYRTGNDVLLVLCSKEYDENDYIRNFQEFMGLVNEYSSINE